MEQAGVENVSACTRCSNVAKAVDRALRALDEGRVEEARTVLADLRAPAPCDLSGPYRREAVPPGLM
jgi:hypothetical protein